MTTPIERTRAVIWTRDFLHEIERDKALPDKTCRHAEMLLRHYPNQFSPHKVKMAMAVSGKNRHYRWNEIRLEHWRETAKECGLGPQLGTLLESILVRVPNVIETVRAQIPPDFPRHVSDSILRGLQKSADQLKAQM